MQIQSSCSSTIYTSSCNYACYTSTREGLGSGLRLELCFLVKGGPCNKYSMCSDTESGEDEELPVDVVSVDPAPDLPYDEKKVCP